MGACGGLPAVGRRGEVDGTNPAHGSYPDPQVFAKTAGAIGGKDLFTAVEHWRRVVMAKHFR